MKRKTSHSKLRRHKDPLPSMVTIHGGGTRFPAVGDPKSDARIARLVYEQDVLSQRATAQASAITGEGASRTPAIEMHVCWVGVIPTILCRTAALLEPPFEMLARAPKRRMVQTVNATLQGSGWYETGTYVWTFFLRRSFELRR